MQVNALSYEKVHTEKKRSQLKSELRKISDHILATYTLEYPLQYCPCCDSKEITYYIHKYGFQLDRCTTCQHIFTNPFPSKEALLDYYNSDFKSFENEFFMESFESRIPIFEERIRLIQNFRTRGHILDIGSSIGIFIEANERLGRPFEITACDINAESCAYLRDKYRHIRVLHIDVSEITLGPYEIVTLWDTIEHITNPIPFLDSIRGLLTKDGVFIFSTPNTDSFEWVTMGTDHIQLLPPGHVNLYNKTNINLLLKRCGFQIEKIYTMNPILDLSYVRYVFKSEIDDDSHSARALRELLGVCLSDEGILQPLVDNMRANLLGGNMLVVARMSE